MPVSILADTSVGVTLNPLIGLHQERGDTVRPQPIPVPFFEIVAHAHRAELYLETLYPVAISFNSQLQGPQSTRLSMINGIARLYSARRRFSLGLGMTVFNQLTHYSMQSTTQASRVVGTRYEAQYRLAESRKGEMTMSLSILPMMRGVVSTESNLGFITLGRNDLGFTRLRTDEPEVGSEVDASLRYVVPRGKVELSYGLRYINYVAVFERSRTIADRNTALFPFFGIRTRLGMK